MGAKREKQAETTSAIRGHFLFNVIYKQLLSLALFDNHIQKHLYCTNEERRRNNKAIKEEEWEAAMGGTGHRLGRKGGGE